MKQRKQVGIGLAAMGTEFALLCTVVLLVPLRVLFPVSLGNSVSCAS